MIWNWNKKAPPLVTPTPQAPIPMTYYSWVLTSGGIPAAPFTATPFTASYAPSTHTAQTSWGLTGFAPTSAYNMGWVADQILGVAWRFAAQQVAEAKNGEERAGCLDMLPHGELRAEAREWVESWPSLGEMIERWPSLATVVGPMVPEIRGEGVEKREMPGWVAKWLPMWAIWKSEGEKLR